MSKFPPPPPPPPSATSARSKVSFGTVKPVSGHRLVLYGPGGIGKTTLAASLPGPVAFFDLDDSLGKLLPNLKAAGVDANIVPVSGISTWDDMRNALQSEGWENIRSIVIDTGTVAEEMAAKYMLANVRTERGGTAQSIEDYGYGRGYQHLYETFLLLLADLDAHQRAGRNVVLICHDCTATVPNPAGEDFLRYEPRLMHPASGKSSIRLRVREWADHVLFVGYDVNVNKDGKGQGTGTRTIYPKEFPHCMAKSRSTQETIPVSGMGQEVWKTIIQ